MGGQGLPFTQVAHHVTSLDCHPTGGNGVLVLVCGNLKIDADAAAQPLKYSQTFVLMPLPTGTPPPLWRSLSAFPEPFPHSGLQKNLLNNP